MKTIIVASILAMAAVCPAIAQTPATDTTKSDKEFISMAVKSDTRATSWLGASVKNGAKETIGDVNDFLIDKDGRVTAAVVGVGGFLGIGEKNVAIPFSAVTMTSSEKGSNVVMVDLTREQLKAAPELNIVDKKTMSERIDQAGERAADAYQETKQTVKEGYEAGKERAKEGYEAAKKSAKEGYEAVKEGAAKGYNAAKTGAEKGYEAAKDQLSGGEKSGSSSTTN